MLAGLSTRRYPLGLKPMGSEVAASGVGTSKRAQTSLLARIRGKMSHGAEERGRILRGNEHPAA